MRPDSDSKIGSDFGLTFKRRGSDSNQKLGPRWAGFWSKSAPAGGGNFRAAEAEWGAPNTNRIAHGDANEKVPEV